MELKLKNSYKEKGDKMDPIIEFMQTEKLDKRNRFVFLNQLAQKGETLFVGSSLMEQFPIYELLMNRGIKKTVYNRGIGGYTTDEMLDSMEDMVFALEPSQIFINIGTNDIGAMGYKLETLIEQYGKILSQIKERLPQTKVYVMAYYPVNETDKVPDAPWGRHLFDTRTNENINLANQAIEKLANKFSYTFINVNHGLTDEHGKLKKEYTIEGIHMYANAYDVILDNLLPYLL